MTKLSYGELPVAIKAKRISVKMPCTQLDTQPPTYVIVISLIGGWGSGSFVSFEEQ